MNKLDRFISKSWQETDAERRKVVVACLFFLGLLVILTFATSCAHTAQGIQREQGIYTVSTNIVTGLQSFTPYLPAPIATPANILLAAISAGLASWNVHQQRALKALRNGNGQGNGCGGTSPAVAKAKTAGAASPPA